MPREGMPINDTAPSRVWLTLGALIGHCVKAFALGFFSVWGAILALRFFA